MEVPGSNNTIKPRSEFHVEPGMEDLAYDLRTWPD
jgi:hypothetical protein